MQSSNFLFCWIQCLDLCSLLEGPIQQLPVARWVCGSPGARRYFLCTKPFFLFVRLLVSLFIATKQARFLIVQLVKILAHTNCRDRLMTLSRLMENHIISHNTSHNIHVLCLRLFVAVPGYGSGKSLRKQDLILGPCVQESKVAGVSQGKGVRWVTEAETGFDLGIGIRKRRPRRRCCDLLIGMLCIGRHLRGGIRICSTHKYRCPCKFRRFA